MRQLWVVPAIEFPVTVGVEPVKPVWAVRRRRRWKLEIITYEEVKKTRIRWADG